MEETSILDSLIERMAALEIGVARNSEAMINATLFMAEGQHIMLNLITNFNYNHNNRIDKPTENGHVTRLLVTRKLILLMRYLTIDLNDYLYHYENEPFNIRNEVPRDIDENIWKNAIVLYKIIYNKVLEIINEERANDPELMQPYSNIDYGRKIWLFRLFRLELLEHGILINLATNYWLADYFASTCYKTFRN